jgi:hypothetical protein
MGVARAWASASGVERSRVMQLIVFTPTTLENYRAGLRYAEAPRELPE